MKRPLLAPGSTWVKEINKPLPIGLAWPVRNLFRAWDSVGDEVRVQFIDQHRAEIAGLLGLLDRASNGNIS